MHSAPSVYGFPYTRIRFLPLEIGCDQARLRRRARAAGYVEVVEEWASPPLSASFRGLDRIP